MRNVIISGASGFIGKALVKRLLEEDVHIWTLDRNHNTDNYPLSEKITLLHNKSIQELKTELENISFDSFYNLAWQGVNGNLKSNYDVQVDNIKLTLHYAELAHVLGCKKFLSAGTLAERIVDSIPKLNSTTGGMMYGTAKLCTRIFLETYCKYIGLDFVWMQFANIYGPENKTGNLISYTIDKLKNDEVASFGPANQPYDFIYIDDLIEAIYRLGIKKTNKNFYYIGSGTPMILKEYLLLIGELYKKADLVHIGERMDDGVEYSYEMMNNSDLIDDIGSYVSDSFENHIRYTIKNYK